MELHEWEDAVIQLAKEEFFNSFSDNSFNTDDIIITTEEEKIIAKYNNFIMEFKKENMLFFAQNYFSIQINQIKKPNLLYSTEN